MTLIVLEGIDGSGTTTQLSRVAEALQRAGHEVHETCEPSKSEIGQLLRRHLADNAPRGEGYWAKLALLYAADRLEHIDHEIAPQAAKGRLVLSDRYVLSSLVYQSLHLPLETVRAFNQFAPAADLTVVVDVPVPVAKARRESRARKELFDDDAFQERLRKAYVDLAPEVNAHVIDGDRSPDAITADIVALISAALERA